MLFLSSLQQMHLRKVAEGPEELDKRVSLIDVLPCALVLFFGGPDEVSEKLELSLVPGVLR